MGVTPLNPGHPVTDMAMANGLKILAIILHKLKLGTVLVTVEDLQAYEREFTGKGWPSVVINGKGDTGFEVSLKTECEARALAAREGGWRQ